MLLFDGTLGLLFVAVWIFCIIDVATTPAGEVRNLPKLAWLAIVVLLLDVGALAWLVAGRNWTVGATKGDAVTGTRAPGRPSSPDDDDDFLASLRARADEQRRRARDPRDDPAGDAPGERDSGPTA